MDVKGAICKKEKAACLRRLQLRLLKASAVDVPSKKTRCWDEKPTFSSTTSSSSSCSGSSSPESSSPDSGEAEAPGEDEEEKRSVCVSHGCVSLIGWRREMEDAVAVKTGFFGGGEYDFYGVYDGHGGAWVAEACRERMHVVIAEDAAAAAAGEVEEDEGRWRTAMAEGFGRMDREVAAEKTVGSTAVVAVVGRRWILVANCGDSRAVLSRGGFVVPLSEDHKPERPDEMKRIEEAGGRIINWDGYRVLGVLATSRSIGDYYLKPYVTAEPEITVTQRSDRDEFLILASDGLWDVVSNEVACRVTRQCLSGQTAKMFPDDVHGHSAAEAAALLAELAMSRGSKDNISIVVVELAGIDIQCSSRRRRNTKL